MPLRSGALRDDRVLQACLLHDTAHVVPGAKGHHVNRIQKALILIEKANISVQEMRGQLYGPATKAAVLAYKKKRKIINTSYQKTADNIVGKMTIARLDEELLALERKLTPGRSECGENSGGGGGSALAISGSSSVLAPSRRHPVPRQHNAKISVMFQETEAAQQYGGAMTLLSNIFARARKLMAPHGLDFAGGDGGLLSLIGPRIPDFEPVIPGSPASCFSVRAASERVLAGRDTTLRVIFCPWADKSKGYGVTDGGHLSDWNFPKFCLINVRKAHADAGTLLHEMIHAARPEFLDHDGDKSSVFSEEEQGRDQLPDPHAESVAKAYYSVIHL